jgi:O-antigen/teichoic acid export membrane protein
MGNNKGKTRIILKDAAITLIAEMVVLFSFFIFYRVLNDQYGSDNLGIYALGRRIIAVLIPFLLLGLHDGIGRYLAIVNTSRERSVIMLSGVITVVIMSSLVGVFVYTNKYLVSELLFGDEVFVIYVLPTYLLLFGLTLHTLTHAILRGRLMIKWLNLFQVLNLAFLPIVIVNYYQGEFHALISLIGVTQALVAVLILGYLLLNDASNIRWRNCIGVIKDIFSYSIPRIPHGLIVAGMLAASPLMATGVLSMSEIGYLALSFTLLIGLASFASPLGLVLLPHLSAMVANREIHRIGENVYLLVGAVIQIFLFICIQFIIFSEYLILFWMGESFSSAIPTVSVVFISIIFYGFYIATRSILDAVSIKPINTINAAISFSVLVLSTYFVQYLSTDNKVVMYAIAFTFSNAILGVLTYRSIRQLMPDIKSSDKNHLKWGLILSIAAGIVSVIIYDFVIVHWLVFIFVEAILFIVYLFALYRLGAGWVLVLWEHAPLRGVTSAH